MSDALEKPDAAAMLERVVVGGNLAELKPAERLAYYRAVCDSVGLNPLTKPFDYLQLSGRLVLYAKKEATDQLRKIHGVSITKLERESSDGVYIVTAYASSGDRIDSSLGAVNIDTLRGEAKANAMMKAETKAKRRVTLSICGLGVMDESEVEDALLADQFKETQTKQPETTVVNEAPQLVLTAEDDERGDLVKEITRLSQKLKLKEEQRATYRKTYLGGSDPLDTALDIVALRDLTDALLERAGEPKRKAVV